MKRGVNQIALRPADNTSPHRFYLNYHDGQEIAARKAVLAWLRESLLAPGDAESALDQIDARQAIFEAQQQFGRA